MAYVYHIVVDDVVRYVGKGNAARIKDHVRTVRSMIRRKLEAARQSTEFYRLLKKAWLGGQLIEEIIVVDGLTERQAFIREKAEIKKHFETLWGGERANIGSRLGRPGSPRVWTRKQRREQSEMQKEAWTDPEVRQQHIEDRKKKWANPRFRKQMQEWREDYYQSRFKSSIQKQVLDLLKKHPDGLKPREITDKLNLIGAQQQNMLSKLRRKGLIKRYGDNHYEYRYTLK